MNRSQKTHRSSALAVLAVVVPMPLLGAWLSGRPVERIFAFPPPLAIPSEYLHFSWIALILIVAPFIALALSLTTSWRRERSSDRTARKGELRTRRFAAWGWISLGWTAFWWVFAWTRFAWFEPLQRYTFFPLWLGFIVTVNALVQLRTGTCHMLRDPRGWLRLFAASAAFWWVFEWLNRFSENWHYLSVSDFGPGAYALNATLCFSTVLPAVAAVCEWLRSFHAFRGSAAFGPRLVWLGDRRTAWFLIAGALAGLLGTGAMPTLFYPALWAAPLALWIGLSLLGPQSGRPTLAAEVASGDWRRAGSWAVAALICGFFWEMWNVHSEAKWIYTVPYADWGHVFEMPVLGYLGYLPFGLECYFVVDRLLGDERLAPFSSVSST